MVVPIKFAFALRLSLLFALLIPLVFCQNGLAKDVTTDMANSSVANQTPPPIALFQYFPPNYEEHVKMLEGISPLADKGDYFITFGNDFIRLGIFTKEPLSYTVTKDGAEVLIRLNKRLNANLDGISSQSGGLIEDADIYWFGRRVKLQLATRSFYIRKFVSPSFIGIDIVTGNIQELQDSRVKARNFQTEKLFKTQQKTANNRGSKFAQSATGFTRFSATAPVPSRTPNAKRNLPDYINITNKPSTKSIGAKSLREVLMPSQKQEQQKQQKQNPLPATDKSWQISPLAKIEQQRKWQEEPKPKQEQVKPTKKDDSTELKDMDNATEYAGKKRVRELSSVSIEESSGNLRIIFPSYADYDNKSKKGEAKTAAAMFFKNNYLWIILDQKYNINLQDFAKIKYFKTAYKLPNPQYTILRFLIRDEFAPLKNISGKTALTLHSAISKEQWIAEIREEQRILSPSQTLPLKSIMISQDSTSSRNRILLNVKKLARPLEIEDKELGTKLAIIPLYQEGQGVAPKRQMVDFTLHQTAQGVLIERFSDRMKYYRIKDGIEIVGAWNINPDLIAKKASKDLIEIPENSFISFPIESLKQKEQKGKNKGSKKNKKGKENEDSPNFKSRERELRKNIINAMKMGNRNIISAEKYRLGKYYFFNELFREAEAIFRNIKTEDPLSARSPEFKLAYGLSMFKNGKYDLAKTEFGETALLLRNSAKRQEPEFLKWAAEYMERKKLMLKNPKSNYKNFPPYYFAFLEKYPAKLRHEFAKLAIGDEIERGNLENATEVIDLILAEDVDEKTYNDLYYLQSIIAKKQGYLVESKGIWEELKQNIKDRKNRAKATFELIKAKHEAQEQPIEKTIEDLENILFTWRSDKHEIDLLNYLSDLYCENNQYEKCLTTLKSIVSNFPDNAEALKATAKMTARFVDIFGGKSLEQFEPLEVIKIFLNFKEITPVDERGKKLVENFVKYLEKLDLLDSAEEVLKNRITFFATGKDRNDFILQLANIQLKNKKPQDSLKTLELFNKPISDDASLADFKAMKAKTLLKLGREKEAFSLINENIAHKKSNIDDLINLYLSQKNWDKLTELLEEYEQALSLNNLTLEQAKKLNYLAMSYSMQSNKAGLQNLKAKYAPYYDKNFKKDEDIFSVFNFLTNHDVKLKADAIKETSQIDLIEDFVNSYAFWQSKNWDGVISVLAPNIMGGNNNLLKNQDIALEDKKNIIKLIIAYNLYIKNFDAEYKGNFAEPKMAEKALKDATKNLANLQKNHGQMEIKPDILEIFTIFDDKLFPRKYDTELEKGVLIQDVDNFIKAYEKTTSISELNEMLINGIPTEEVKEQEEGDEKTEKEKTEEGKAGG